MDRQTDGIAIASTALAIAVRALRRAVKMGVVLRRVQSESQWTLLLAYLTNISQQMLSAIKHVADDNSVFLTGEWCTQHSSTAAV